VRPVLSLDASTFWAGLKSQAGRGNNKAGHARKRAVQALLLSNKPPEDEPEKETSLDEFLDTPFFDPQKVLEDEENANPFAKVLAKWVIEDPETSEVVLAGSFFVVLVILSQELLRMQMFGDSYVAFTRGGGSGSLF
jgi:hypothetical protein